jgi:hypothetical protein
MDHLRRTPHPAAISWRRVSEMDLLPGCSSPDRDVGQTFPARVSNSLTIHTTQTCDTFSIVAQKTRHLSGHADTRAQCMAASALFAAPISRPFSIRVSLLERMSLFGDLRRVWHPTHVPIQS